jgi:flagellar protein FlaG
MKINGNQNNPNISGITNQIAGSKVQEPKQTKPAEGIRDVSHKPKSEPDMDEKQWIEVIEKANRAIEGATCSFEFSIHERTKQIMVKVIDKDTKEVIREFPPEKILDMVAKMWEVAGIIVDERRNGYGL